MLPPLLSAKTVQAGQIDLPASPDASEARALVARAAAAFAAGRLDEAETLSRHALESNPADFDALHLLGGVEAQRGRLGLALDLWDKARTIKPQQVGLLNNYGIVLCRLKRPEDALKTFDQALAIKPDFAEAYFNRGNALKELKRTEEALASYHKAFAIKPDYAEAYCHGGAALMELKRAEEALASYDKALAIKPNYAEALNNRGAALMELKRAEEALASCDRALAIKPDYAEAFNNRGAALKELTRTEEALASYDKALAIKPDYAGAYNNRGNALRELNRAEEALTSYDKALAIEPDYAEAYCNRGAALLELNRAEEALVSCERALAIKRDYAAAFNNRGNALVELKRTEEALASYGEALAIKPDYAEAYWNRALCRLHVGRYREGLADYEWRSKTKFFPGKRHEISAPPWRGQDLSGRHLVVYAEQGLGDNIQFARYLPLLIERKAKVTFLVDAKLIRLLRPLTEQVEIASELGTEDAFDFQCALMSLPHLFNTDLSSIPDKVPYLRAEESLIASWKERIGEDGFKIGIAWQGNPQFKHDRGRSIPLEEFIPLTRLPSARLISLQSHYGLDQLVRLPADAKIETLGDDFGSGPDAFIDAAAVMSNLDLIISSDTASAHLAGALGRPTWVALRYVPDWRWMLDRDDSPWYPTTRLFRQQDKNDWKPVFRMMENELTSLLSRQPPAREGRQGY